MAKFSVILNRLREEKGVAQKDLAELLCLTKGTISNYETGKYEPDIASLKLLAKYFDVSVDYLLGNTETKASYRFWNEKFAGKFTYGEMVQHMKDIPPEKRDTVLQVILAFSKK